MAESTVFLYDVFISYSHRDKEWVGNSLLTQLEAINLRTCIDFRDFEIGVPVVEAMARAIENSWKTILVLTPSYLKSDWAAFESLLLQTLDPANCHQRLIPLLKENCDLPLRLRYLHYVDFTQPEYLALAWKKLAITLDVSKSPSSSGSSSLLMAESPSKARSLNREGLERVLRMAHRTLEILETQAAAYTNLSIPAHLQIELEEQRRKVNELERRLQEIE